MSQPATLPLTIKLLEPFEGHHGLITELRFRPPKWSDVMGVGAPYTVHTDKEGKPFLVYDEAAIEHYAEACLVEPANPVLVSSQVGLADTLRVREAIIDFFLGAAAAGGGSKTSPKSSSSSSGSSPTPSDG